MARKITATVAFEAEQLVRLDRISERTRRSRSEITRAAVDRELDRLERELSSREKVALGHAREASRPLAARRS